MHDALYHTGKLEIWALAGIQSFSIILENKSTKPTCVTNFENIVPDYGDDSEINDSHQKMELVQCLKQNVRIVFQ